MNLCCLSLLFSANTYLYYLPILRTYTTYLSCLNLSVPKVSLLDFVRCSQTGGHIATCLPLVSNMDAEKRKRLFIGIACPPSQAVKQVLTELQTIAENPSAGLRPVVEENLHITLKFLGMIPKSEIAMICQLMQHTVTRQSPFTLHIHGFGCFRQALWLGVRDSEELTELAGNLDLALAVIGAGKEKKPFMPHLTVARMRPNAQLKLSNLQEQYGHRDLGTLSVDTVHLFESETLPEGARYSRLFSATLAS